MLHEIWSNGTELYGFTIIGANHLAQFGVNQVFIRVDPL